MRNKNFVWILFTLIVLVDLYVFAGLKSVTQHLSDRSKTILHIAYWTVSILAIVCFLSFAFFPVVQASRNFKTYVFSIVLGLFLSKLICTIILLIDDIRRGITWSVFKVAQTVKADPMETMPTISRSVFLSWIGIALGSTLFATMLFGFKN